MTDEHLKRLKSLIPELENLIENGNCRETPAGAPLNTALLADAYGHIEQLTGPVGAILLSYRDHADIRKFCLGMVDPETNVERVKEGVQGVLWTGTIVADRQVPLNHVFVIAFEVLDGKAPTEKNTTVIKLSR